MKTSYEFSIPLDDCGTTTGRTMDNVIVIQTDEVIQV
jgi:hypothetical protein